MFRTPFSYTGLAIFWGLLWTATAAWAQTDSPSPTPPKYKFGAFGQFTPQGMLIQRVTPNEPADKAGLRAGDVVLRVDNVIVKTQEQFTQIIEASAGAVELSVRRQTGFLEKLTVELNVDRRGRGILAPYHLGVLGQFTGQGMLLQKVGLGTPADKAGLQVSDTIVRLNGRAVTNQQELFTLLEESGGTAELDVRFGRTGKVGRVTAHLDVYRFGTINDYTPNGMVLLLVAPNTPAARMNLQTGDIVLAINDRPVLSQRDLDLALDNSGGAINIAVRRGINANRTAMELMNNALGVWCEPTRDGLRVTTVPPGSLGQRLGVQRGDLIMRVDRQNVTTLVGLQRALEFARGTLHVTVREGRSGNIIRLETDLGR